jgi:hypothetical protein
MEQLRPLLTLIALNLFEFFGLVIWLQLADRTPPSPDNPSLSTILPIVGALILIAGLFLERFIVYLMLIRPIAKDERVGLFAKRFIIQGVRETLIWVVWLWIANTLTDFGYIVSFVFLFFGQLYEHCVDVAEHNNVSPMSYATNPKVLFLTLAEAVGAVAWLYLLDYEQQTLGTAVLFVAFLIEHIFQGQMVQIKPPANQPA